jgi:hypothetical protein
VKIHQEHYQFTKIKIQSKKRVLKDRLSQLELKAAKFKKDKVKAYNLSPKNGAKV